ncbi:MAG: hypothetical protein KGZ39_04150 [Simkania sp.]|nr:hypothetical protein [Simkania sp.]
MTFRLSQFKEYTDAASILREIDFRQKTITEFARDLEDAEVGVSADPSVGTVDAYLQDIQRLNEQAKTIEKLTLKPIKARVRLELDHLAKDAMQLRSRVLQLGEEHTLYKQLEIIRAEKDEGTDETNWGDLAKRTTHLITKNPNMPLRLLADFADCKASIDSRIEQGKIYKKYAYVLALLDIKGTCEDYLDNRPVLQQMLPELRERFSKLPRDIRLKVYSAIAIQAKRQGSDVAYGKDNLFTSITRFIKVVGELPEVQRCIMAVFATRRDSDTSA